MKRDKRPIAVVVNDDPTQLQLMTGLLEKDGLRVLGCRGAEDALEALRQHGPVDIIVTDLYMPGIDGWRFCHLLRSPEYAEYNKIPILVVSATFSGAETEEVTSDLGANAFLPLPLNPSMLQAHVRSLLEGRTLPATTRVLIVEDDAALCEMLTNAFASHGYTPYTATTGEKGEHLYEKYKPQVTILDYHLPDMKADRLLKKIKHPGSHTVAIVITGDESPDTALQVIREGADAYVRKPFRPSYLIELCQKARRERSLLRVEELLEARTQELRRSEERYRTLIENLGEGVALVDPEERFTYTNPAMENIFGLPAESLVGRTLEEFTDPDQFAAIRRQTGLRQAGKKSTYEFDIIRPDGQRRQLMVTATPQVDEQGQYTGALGIFRDITERKQAVAALRESEAKFRTLAETVAAAIFIYRGTQLCYVNSAAETITGYTRDELLTMNLFDLVHPDSRDLVGVRAEARQKGEAVPDRYEFKLINRARQVRWLDYTAGVIEFEGAPAVLGTAFDITERKQAEAALRESEERYRDLFENASDIIYTHDFNGKLTSVNRTGQRVYGYSAEEVLQLHINQIVDPDYMAVAQESIREKLEGTEQVKPYELLTHTKEGSPVWVEVSTRLIKDEGQPIGIQGIARDVTERKRAEAALRKRTEHQTALLKLARMDTSDLDSALRGITEVDSNTLGVERVSVWLFNEDHTEILCRDAYTQSNQTHGRGNKLRAVEYPRYFQALEESRIIAAKDAQADARTKEFTQGYLKPHHVTSMMDVPIRLHGNVVGILCHEHTGSQRDWTLEEQDFAASIADMVSLALETSERLQAETALAAEKERLAVTLRSIGEGVITTDTQDRIVLINKVAETLTGWTQHEAIGKPLTEVFHTVDEKTRQRCENPVEKVLSAGGKVTLSDTILIGKDGSETLIVTSGAPIHDRETRLIGVVLVFHDVSEKRKMEQELIKAQKLESLGLLAGGIAHDFNNILMAILGNISLAKMFAPSEDRILRKLTSAEKATLQAKTLTQQLLTFSKGGAPIKKTASISEIIKDSAEFALRGSNVKCKFRFQEDLWLVDVDETQMSQVINNLMINADQAMPNGGTIDVRAENISLDAEHPPLDPGNYVTISIADQGIGIPAEHLPKVFDPYFTTKEKGSGLGLATAYSIVNRHGGTITVDSTSGVGTTVTIYLPASQKGTPPKQEEETTLVLGKGRILIMDDEPFIRDVAAELLTNVGYQVEVAGDGTEAIETYKRAKEAGHPFDAVIMDLTIPGGMGGREAIKKLREIDPEVKAIVSSGYSNDPVMAEFQRFGFCGVVAKPFRIQQLSQTLRSILNRV